MDLSILRAWWWRRQGLDGSLAGNSPAASLELTGWARSVGGAAPYLTLFARGGLSREAIDAAVAAVRVQELPAARGCTYVVPAADYEVALTASQNTSDEAAMKAARKIGATDIEVARLKAGIVRALANGPLDTDQLREACGRLVRNLGPEGKQKGVTTTLPLALGFLQAAGEIRRIPINGRLDQQRYRYALWRPNPVAGRTLSKDEAHVELARRYFRWIGPATLGEFQSFSGLTQKAARAAVDALELVPVEDRFIAAEDFDALSRCYVPHEPQYALLASLDGLALLRRDIKSLLDYRDLSRPLSSMPDLPNHGIFDRGRLIGLWEYDTESASIVWTTFVPRNEALEQAVARTEEFVRTQLGDARSFSLDSPQSRAPRIAALRAEGA